MTEALQQKLIDGTVKGLVAIITGGGLATFSTTWVGEAAYQSTKRRLNGEGEVIFPEAPLPQLLDAWSSRVLTDSLAEIQAVLFVLLVVLLSLVAHVVMRGSLGPDEAGDAPASQTWAGEDPPPSRGTRRLRRLYRKAHCGLTVAIFLLLAALLWHAPSAAVLAASFALLMIPGVLYLMLYAGDVRRPRFAPRFTWIACAVLIFSALLTSPRIYGDRFFHVELIQVVSPDGSQATFAFRDAPSVGCDIEFGERSLTIWIHDLEDRWERASSGTSTLADLLKGHERRALTASATVSEVDKILANALEE